MALYCEWVHRASMHVIKTLHILDRIENLYNDLIKVKNHALHLCIIESILIIKTQSKVGKSKLEKIVSTEYPILRLIRD